VMQRDQPRRNPPSAQLATDPLFTGVIAHGA
jgi:hypothetical protein